jgi:hypothetical protein
MTLLEAQCAFLAEITAPDDDARDPALGMTIYREGYRSRLMGALEVSFERTRRWVGEQAFGAAAAHYVLSSPPHSWTLDRFGDRFPECLATLFVEDPEVAELAWLEWHRQQAFAAPDLPRLDPAGLASAGLSAPDWERLTFTVAAGFAARTVAFDCQALWGLAETQPGGAGPSVAAKAGHLIVWRDDLRPHHRLLGPDEYTVLAQLAAGVPFGIAAVAPAGVDELAHGQAVGRWLAQWLQGGLFAGWALADQA